MLIESENYDDAIEFGEINDNIFTLNSNLRLRALINKIKYGTGIPKQLKTKNPIESYLWSDLFNSDKDNDNSLEKFHGHMNFGNIPIDLESGITISFWLKLSNRSNGAILSKGGSWQNDGFGVTYFNNNIRFELQNIALGEKVMQDIDYPYLDYKGVWSFITFTWSNKDKTMKAYLNGKLVDQGAKFNGPIVNPDQALTIGYQERALAYFSGSIANLRLYSRELSNDEISKSSLNPNEVKDGVFFNLDKEFENIDYFSLSNPKRIRKINITKNITSINEIGEYPEYIIKRGQTNLSQHTIDEKLNLISKRLYSEAITLINMSRLNGRQSTPNNKNEGSYIDFMLLAICHKGDNQDELAKAYLVIAKGKYDNLRKSWENKIYFNRLTEIYDNI